jgi:hypothetical protein
MIDSVQGSLEMFLVPNTWVKHDVEQIDEEIDDYESETDEQNGTSGREGNPEAVDHCSISK